MNAVLNAALPVFALILLGYGAGRGGLFDRAATDNLNRFAFYLALPALLFLAMSRITPAQIEQGGFVLAFGGGMVLTFGLGFALCRLRGGRLAAASIEGLDAGYGNVGFMGIPLCLLVFGRAGLPMAVIATLLVACGLFLFSIVLVEADLQRGGGLGRVGLRVGLSLLRNPLLLAPVGGLAVGLTGAGLPAPLVRFAELLGGAASPVALICIGLFLAQERVSVRDARPIAVLVALKLVVQPGVTALVALGVFHMPPLWSHSAVLLAALPIGSGPFTIAKLYGLEAGVTSGAILVSHLVSVVTVSVLVAWMG